jgi:hypothetical protein
MGLIDTYTKHDVTITPKGTVGNDGSYPCDGSAVSTVARVVEKRGVRRHGADTEWEYKLIVYFQADETITLQDQVTWESQTYRVKELEPLRDIAGRLQHYKAYCG